MPAWPNAEHSRSRWPTGSKLAPTPFGPVRGGAHFGIWPFTCFLPRPLSFIGRRIPIPSTATLRSHRTRARGRLARARLPKGRTARLPRTLPQEIGCIDDWNDGSMDCEFLSLFLSRDEQR